MLGRAKLDTPGHLVAGHGPALCRYGSTAHSTSLHTHTRSKLKTHKQISEYSYCTLQICCTDSVEVVVNQVNQLPLGLHTLQRTLRRGKLNSQFIVTARIDLSIFTKNFKFQSLLLLSLQ